MCDLIEDHEMQIPMFRATSEIFKPVIVQQRPNDGCRRPYPGAHVAKCDSVVESGAGVGSAIGVKI